jgi:hypothetical protein
VTKVAKRCLICRKDPAIPGRYYCSWSCRQLDGKRICPSCLEPVRTVRRDAEYCSNACRQRAYRARRDWELDNEAKLARLRSSHY